MSSNGESVWLDSLKPKSLYDCIDMEKVLAINEKERKSCLNIINRSSSEIDNKVAAYAKDNKGLVIKIPFTWKVSLDRVELRTTFKTVETFINNQYVTLTYKAKSSSECTLPGSEDIVPIMLNGSKHRAVDTITLRFNGIDEVGSISYLCIFGKIMGPLPKAIDVLYELYPTQKVSKEFSEQMSRMEIEKD